MKKIIITMLSLLTLVQIGFSLSTIDVAKKIKPATVTIIVFDKNQKELGHGSGYFYFDGQYPDAPAVAVTNFHVVSGKSNKSWHTFSYQVVLADGTKLPLAKFNYTDEEHDLALLIFDTIKAKDQASISPEPANTILVEGQRVVVIGTPADTQLSGTLSEGIISAIREKLGVIQFSAPVAFGSSGSALCDENGQLIGTVQAIEDLSKAENINFAIPAKWTAKLYADFIVAWKKYQKDPSVVKNPSKNTPQGDDENQENSSSLNN